MIKVSVRVFYRTYGLKPRQGMGGKSVQTVVPSLRHQVPLNFARNFTSSRCEASSWCSCSDVKGEERKTTRNIADFCPGQNQGRSGLLSWIEPRTFLASGQGQDSKLLVLRTLPPLNYLTSFYHLLPSVHTLRLGLGFAVLVQYLLNCSDLGQEALLIGLGHSSVRKLLLRSIKTPVWIPTPQAKDRSCGIQLQSQR